MVGRMNDHERSRRVGEKWHGREQAAQDQECEEPASPPKRRVDQLVSEEASVDPEEGRELISDLIEELCEASQRIGVEEPVVERLRLA